MDTLICAGGSGTRVLESVLHLCAMGLGPDKLRMFLIDSDDDNGNGNKTLKLVTRYRELHEIFGGGPFFRTELNLLCAGQAQQKLQVWKPVDPGQPFNRVLNYGALTKEQRDVVHLLFTDEELAMPMRKGFRGRPALGAAALALLPLYRTSVPLWAEFQGALQADLAREDARVMIVGSVFGGTGAATIHPLLKYLRSKEFLGAERKNLQVGAVALVPYFEFDIHGERAVASSSSNDENAARSQEFPLACRSAAEYYNHLRETNDWDFDAMFWIGDDSPMTVAYSTGGSTQNNPAHFVDLLGALASLDFFCNGPMGKTCWYAGPAEDADHPGQNCVKWEDLPMRAPINGRDLESLARAVHEFHMVAVAHIGFFEPLLKHPSLRSQAHRVPWYRNRLSGEDNLLSMDSQRQLDVYTAYLKEDYLPWWRDIHSVCGPTRVQLLNASAWTPSGSSVDCSRLGNLLPPDAATHRLDTVDTLFSRMVEVSSMAPDRENTPSRYIHMLHLAAQPVVMHLHKKNEPKKAD